MFAIRKDGLWLMNYQYNGIEEFVGDGTFTHIPTCAYSSNYHDARLFADQYKAQQFATLLGGEVVRLKAKPITAEDLRHEN